MSKKTTYSKSLGLKTLRTTILTTKCGGLVHLEDLQNAAPFGQESAVHVMCQPHMQLGLQDLAS